MSRIRIIIKKIYITISIFVKHMYIYVRYCLLFFMDCFPLCDYMLCLSVPFISWVFSCIWYMSSGLIHSASVHNNIIIILMHSYKYRFDISQLFPLICITNVGLGEFRTRLITRHAV